MVNELLYSTPVSFDALCAIAEKTLRPAVFGWCQSEDCLRGRGYEEDILQEIYLRLMKTTVAYFLLRDGCDKPFNDDPEGFEDWLYKVAENLKRDFANQVRNRDFKTENMDQPAIEAIAQEESCDQWEQEERILRLRQAFSVVLSSDVSVYKVLTWLAQFLLVLSQDVTKIQSNDLIITAFAERSLYDMYGMLLSAAQKIPWLRVTEEQNEKILCALRKKRAGDVTYGETKYKDFFMKHNGEVSGKKSISDWVNRMNGKIQSAEERARQLPAGAKKGGRR